MNAAVSATAVRHNHAPKQARLYYGAERARQARRAAVRAVAMTRS